MGLIRTQHLPGVSRFFVSRFRFDETSQFKATITFDDKGVPTVEYSPKFDGSAEAAKRIYTIYGKKNLADKDWIVVDGHEADYNFFKVTVEMK